MSVVPEVNITIDLLMCLARHGNSMHKPICLYCLYILPICIVALYSLIPHLPALKKKPGKYLSPCVVAFVVYTYAL